MKTMKSLYRAIITITAAVALSISATGMASASESIVNNPSDTAVSETGYCKADAVLTTEDQELVVLLTAELERFDKVTDIENIELTAQQLYPNDVSLQKEYIKFASEPLADIHEVRAIPAVVLAAIPVIAACVARGLSGVALDQVVNALRGNDLAKADDLIWSFAAGCVGFGPLKWAFNAAKPVASRALTWAVKEALKLAGKFK